MTDTGSATLDATPLLGRHAFTHLLVRGILAVVLALLFFFAPAIAGTAAALFIVIVVAIWLIADGISSISAGITAQKRSLPGAGWTIAGGVVSILAGICALIFPLSTAAFGGLLVLWILAFGAIARGAAELFGTNIGGWTRVLGGLNVVLGILMAVVVFLNPAAALTALIWVAAVYTLIFGIAAIAAAFAARSITTAA